jgi:UDP-N-acetylmuramate dehydrogenase
LGRRDFQSWAEGKWGAAVLRDEPLSRHTSWKVGGPCDLMIFPRDRGELREIIEKAGQEGEALFVMGRGTNLLVLDGGIRGAVINLSRGLKQIALEGERVRAGAGADLPWLAAQVARSALAGLEFAGGIPGTVGGAIRGNAGAFGSSVDQILKGVKILDWQGQNRILNRKDVEFSYRDCRLPCEGVIVEAEFELRQDDPVEVSQRMEDFRRERGERQPLQAVTAGSVFKNPPGAYAGQIIESLGLKGKILGGARISSLHGNFIENLGDARAADLLALIRLIRDRAEEKLGIRLELEIQVMGEK